jgi:hypothetical protein
MVAAALVGLAGLVRGGPQVSPQSTAPGVEPAAASIAYEYFDFFNVPYGEWWDYRTAVYGDLPMNAECFSAAGIANGICTPNDANLRDIPSAPYTNWYPLPGAIFPSNPNANPLIYAPYRFRATGVDVPGYSLSDPVFLPVLNPGAAPGSRLEFDWRMQYLDTASANALEAAGCPVSAGVLDGFQIRSQVQLTLDLQESRRIFNVVGADAAAAQSWWNSNTVSSCFGQGAAEDALEAWFVSLGGSASVVGKYDIYNSFEWYYQPFYTQVSATVDAEGTTRVAIDHVAWGTDVVMSRIFYWGTTSYAQNYLDSTRAAGWWGMELAWFEDLSFAGSLAGTDFDFSLASVMQYHFQQLAAPGANGLFDQTDDIPYWTWGPILTDYTNDASARHLLSELDRYPSPTYAYVHSTPGSRQYGVSLPYDYAPIRWDLDTAESWTFRFPTADVVFYNPNLTPIGADPTLGQFVEIAAPLEFLRTNPAALGTYDALTATWSVVGPTSTGGPAGSPGADGIPGTADDQYALDSWGAILFVPHEVTGPLRVAGLVGRSAWPERHHWDQSNDADGMVSLFAKVANLGNTMVSYVVVFEVRDSAGTLVTVQTSVSTLDAGQSAVVSAAFTPSAFDRYSVSASVMYDSEGDGSLDATGLKTKSFSFAAVP